MKGEKTGLLDKISRLKSSLAARELGSRVNRNVLVRVLICIGLVAFGLIGKAVLTSMKKPPAETAVTERALRVEVTTARPEDVPAVITGYGEVRPLNSVVISPEVAGRVVEVHPRLEKGEIIPQGDVLFKIDPTDYKAAHDEALASISQLTNAIALLKEQYAIDKKRLKTLKRSNDLADRRFKRLTELLEKDKVGTIDSVEAAEQAFNTTTDAVQLLERSVSLYPLRIRETESSLMAAEARASRVSAQLGRCVVRAPFPARLVDVNLEADQYVMPGQQALTLADDSTLELHVPIDSRDARKWLLFNDTENGNNGWLKGLKNVECGIRWTEDKENRIYTGRLHRAVRFNSDTRTLTVAIRMDSEHALPDQPNALPLIEGMFCHVEIPGRTIRNVVRLPRWSVTFDNNVYISVDNRLKTVPVVIARMSDKEAFIAKGVEAGDMVITTRLVHPLEGSLLEPAPEATGDTAP